MATQLQNNVRVVMIAEINEFSVSDEMLQVMGIEADWTSAGRLFQNLGPAAAKERSPTVTRHDGRTSRRLEVDGRSRTRRLVGKSATYCSRSDKY